MFLNDGSHDEAAPIELFMIELEVDDWPGLVRWYEETLGLRVVHRDESGRFVLFAAGAGRLALKQSPVSMLAQNHVRLAFRVSDVDAERARLLALGVLVSAPVDNPREPYREVRLADPEGLPITLFAWTRPAT